VSPKRRQTEENLQSLGKFLHQDEFFSTIHRLREEQKKLEEDLNRFDERLNKKRGVEAPAPPQRPLSPKDQLDALNAGYVAARQKADPRPGMCCVG